MEGDEREIPVMIKESEGKKTNIIYMIKNLVDGKVYIGQSGRCFFERYSRQWWKHSSINPYLKKAINKHKKENFQITILEKNKNQRDRNRLEKKYIKLYSSTNRNFGYNMQPGGLFFGLSDETRSERRAEYIKSCQKIHGNKYDYSKLIFTSVNRKGKIFCKKHGKFFTQNLTSHKSGAGCFDCFREAIGDQFRMSQPEFIKRCTKIHKGKFSYDSVKYKNMDSFVAVNCNHCGHTFKKNPQFYLKSSATCPSCRFFGKPIYQIDRNTGKIIRKFCSHIYAGKVLKIRPSGILKALRKERRTYKKCIWRYCDENHTISTINPITL